MRNRRALLFAAPDSKFVSKYNELVAVTRTVRRQPASGTSRAVGYCSSGRRGGHPSLPVACASGSESPESSESKTSQTSPQTSPHGPALAASDWISEEKMGKFVAVRDVEAPLSEQNEEGTRCSAAHMHIYICPCGCAETLLSNRRARSEAWRLQRIQPASRAGYGTRSTARLIVPC